MMQTDHAGSPRAAGVRAALAAEVRAAMAREQVRGSVLAGTIGISPAALSRKLNGKTAFTVEQVIDIAAALGVSARTLLDAAA